MSVVDEPGHDPEDMVHIVVTAKKKDFLPNAVIVRSMG